MKWIDIENDRPKSCEDVLFSDGKHVYYGWLETHEFGEELVFYDVVNKEWPEHVFCWASIPKPPKLRK